MDIGCYLINASRFIFDAEPRRVAGLIDRDPVLKIDRTASMLLDFPPAVSPGPAAPRWSRINACKSSARKGASRSRSRSTRRPTGRAACSWTAYGPFRDRHRDGRSPVITQRHHPGISLLGGFARWTAGPVAARGRDRQHVLYRRGVFRSAESGGNGKRRMLPPHARPEGRATALAYPQSRETPCFTLSSAATTSAVCRAYVAIHSICAAVGRPL